MMTGHSIKKTLFLLMLFLSARTLIISQSYVADYTAVSKETILLETFDPGNTKWPIPQGMLEGGMLIMSDRLNMVAPKTATVIAIDESRDFEIEITASVSSAVLQGQIHWGSGRWEITTSFGSAIFMGNSHIKSFSHKPGKNISHKYTIRRAGSTCYYFIDEKNVGSTAYLKPETPGKLSVGFSGRINIDELKVSYLQKDDPALANNNDETGRNKYEPVEAPPGKKIIQPGGKYYAMIIGVSKYNDPKLYLENPEKDALQVKSILNTRYSFSDSTTIVLLNPTRQKIIAELFRLRRIISSNDNLLIFYAGHGFWDKDAKQGYWWAKDAARDDPSTWLSNSDLREQIRSIKSAHTLLISDACFSGGIFRTRGPGDLMNASKDIQVLYRMPSRRAITSGTMTVVPDNSVFLDYFLKRLKDNQSKFISSQQLFDSFRTAVINNSNVVPQDGVIAETGDEGGDFIFILRDK